MTIPIISNQNGHEILSNALPALSTYTTAQIHEACGVYPVLQHHLNKVNAPGPYGERHRVWCECVLATHFPLNAAIANTEVVCKTWSVTAEKIICEKAHEYFTADEVCLFAFGKLGARELNLSSDVDLLFVCLTSDESLTQRVRKFQQNLSDFTENGFLFRVDYELRPGGKMSQLVPTVDQVMDYYGNYGEAWERLAFIRLRHLWGNTHVAKAIIDFRKRYSFRKHLDYGLLEDLNILRNKVHQFAKQKRKNGFLNLKLEIGGIRDIELFCHALQVIHGGRNSELDSHSTTAAFQLLCRHGVLQKKDSDFLIATYWHLRDLENRSQAAEDAQTHLVELLRLTHDQQMSLSEVMKSVDDLVKDVLGSINTHVNLLPDDFEAQKNWLLENGFNDLEITTHWVALSQVPTLSRQKERDREQRLHFLSQILCEMGKKQTQPNRLSYLREFLIATKAKSSFYSLLIKHPVLIEILSEIFCSSPKLSQLLCHRPEILDSFVMRNVDSIDIHSDWEDFLQGLVDMKQLTEFLAAVDFLRHKDLKKLSLNLSDLADQIINSLWNKIQLDNPTSDIEIWALGKWGSRELGLFSDLDCIFVKTRGEVLESDLKALRRFVNRLTESHRGGSLYSIDTRLRTREQSGILISSAEQVLDYFKSETAQMWERQAYLKCRSVNIESFTFKQLQRNLYAFHFTHRDAMELWTIQQRLFQNAQSEFDLKYSPGGILDTELAVQTALLQSQVETDEPDIETQMNSLKSRNSLWQNAAEKLLLNYQFMRLVEQSLRLFSEESAPDLHPRHLSFAQVAFHLDLGKDSLENTIRCVLNEQVEILKSLDPRRSEK